MYEFSAAGPGSSALTAFPTLGLLDRVHDYDCGVAQPPAGGPDDSERDVKVKVLSSGRKRTVKEKVEAALVRRTPASAGSRFPA